MTPEQTAARSAYDAAFRKLNECKPGDGAAEQQYGSTYRALVTLGLMMRLKKKYRGR